MQCLLHVFMQQAGVPVGISGHAERYGLRAVPAPQALLYVMMTREMGMFSNIIQDLDKYCNMYGGIVIIALQHCTVARACRGGHVATLPRAVSRVWVLVLQSGWLMCICVGVLEVLRHSIGESVPVQQPLQRGDIVQEAAQLFLCRSLLMGGLSSLLV